MALYTKAMSLLSVKDKKTPSARLGRRAECESCILRHYPSAEGRVCSRGGALIACVRRSPAALFVVA